ncbi:hypothetical protein WKH57_25330 [Niallia taxi]|uniref:hypothetical protein n=1 Tax=Niallia taxi TaxID=2499688 RepID=UPI003178D6E4
MDLDAYFKSINLQEVRNIFTQNDLGNKAEFLQLASERLNKAPYEIESSIKNDTPDTMDLNEYGVYIEILGRTPELSFD